MDHSTDTAPSSTDNAVIATIYSCLKTTYLMLRKRRAKTKAYRVSAKYDIGFWELAKTLQGLSISPHEYMEWCFDQLLDRHDDVYGDMVIDPFMVARYQEGAPARNRELELIAGLQAALIKKREERGENLDAILLDEKASISAVMRFAVAHSRGRFDLAENFREDAAEQIMFRPHYKVVLGKFLPKEML